MSEQRVVLISGGARGIGASAAKLLLSQGWRVSLGLRGASLPDWAADCDANLIHHAPYDARDPLAEAKWTASALAHFGRIDAVIASAGISAGKSALEAEDEEIRQMMEVNVLAPRRLAKASWQALAQSGHGRIVILGSLSGKRVKSAASGSYALSKFAAVALSHALRQEGYSLGIRSTVICPGFVATDMARSLTSMSDQAMTQPEDIARMIAMILNLPNEAVVAELLVNCTLEPSF